MKIAVLSDIHGNGTALSYTIKDLKKSGIKKIIILGDVVMKGPMPYEVLEMLNESNLDILAWIKGNTDMWLDEVSESWIPLSYKEKSLYSYYKYAMANLNEEQVSFIKSLPFQCSLRLQGADILCVHGTPQSIVEAIDGSVPEDEIRKAVKGAGEQVILCGHSHTVFIGETDNKKIFNVGSIGNSLDGDNRISYGILDFSGNELKLVNRRISYPLDEIIEKAYKNNFPFPDEYKRIIMTASII